MSQSASPVSLRPEQIALQRQGRDLARWLIIVPVVLFLLFGCSHLALLAAPPLHSVDTRSKLQATYAPWPFAMIPAINTGIVDEIAHDQATPGEPGGFLPPITVTTFWSTPTPTRLGATPPPTTATLSGSPAPTRTVTPLSTVTSQPTVTATVTLTRTPQPTSTRTATATRTLIPLPTRTPTLAPTPTFTLASPTNTSAPPPPPTATGTRTPTRTPTSTAINTATNTPTVTNTPTATNTLVPPNTPTHTPTPTETLTPTPLVCLIIDGGTGGGGSSFSWSVTNTGVATVNLTSVSASWAQAGDVWQSPLDFGGSTVASGWPGINAPGGTVGTSGAVDLPTGSKSLSFNFNNLTSGVTYSVSASFDNGCTVNSSFTS